MSRWEDDGITNWSDRALFSTSLHMPKRFKSQALGGLIMIDFNPNLHARVADYRFSLAGNVWAVRAMRGIHELPQEGIVKFQHYFDQVVTLLAPFRSNV